MSHDVPKHLELYQREEYWRGGLSRGISGYDNYAYCRGVLERWSEMLLGLSSAALGRAPRSVLDVGAAYGFVVEWMVKNRVEAFGVEPSAFCRDAVRQDLQHRVVDGALPDRGPLFQPTVSDTLTFEVVTCTEVLEHVPEELVPSSLEMLAKRTGKLLVLLIMLEGPGADGDEGHICLKSRAWWDEQLDATGLKLREDLETALDANPYSQNIGWSGRFFVRERV